MREPLPLVDVDVVALVDAAADGDGGGIASGEPGDARIDANEMTSPGAVDDVALPDDDVDEDADAADGAEIEAARMRAVGS